MALELAIDEDTIEAQVGRRSLSLGEQYFRDGRLYATRRQGDVLKARCRGQSGGPYRVEATLGAHGVEDASCSCPVGGAGTCKHIAALLIGWQEAADAFTQVPEVEAALAQRTKEQLISLIKQMLRLEPDLETLLELPVPGAGGLDEPIDPEVFRAQAATVFDREDHDWESLSAVVEGLLAIVEIGDEFVEQGEYAGAAAVFTGVAAEAGSARYPDYLYYNDLPIQVARAAEVCRPDEALRVYRVRVDQLIDQRGRDAYREASRLLLRMRAIQARRGEEKAFERYLQSVRDEHPRLRTLAEELSNADL